MQLEGFWGKLPYDVSLQHSRQSITIEGKTPNGKPLPKIETMSSDFVYKTFLLEKQKVSINNYGDSLLGKITTESHIKRFSEEMVDDHDDVTTREKDKMKDNL